MNLKHQAASGVKWNALATIIKTALQVLQLVVLAWLLVPEDFGLMAMVMIVIGFAQAYADAGISAAIIHRQDVTQAQLSSLYWLNILVALAIFVIIWLTAPLLVWLFKAPELIPLVRATAFILIVIALGKQFEILLQKNLRFGTIAKISIFSSTFSTSITLITAFAGYGAWALVWGQLGLTSTSTIALMRVGWRDFRPRLHFRLKDLRGYISFGLYQLGERSVGFASQKIDQLLLGSILGTTILGYYSFASTIALLPRGKMNPILNRVMFPVLAKIQQDRDRLQSTYIKIIRLLTTINAPLLIGLAAVSPVAVPLIFGNQWLDSVVLIQVLCVIELMRTIGNSVGNLLLAKGRADTAFIWNLFLLLVTIPIVYIGASLAKVIGVATSLVFIQTLAFFLTYFYLVRPITGSCGWEYTNAIASPVMLAGSIVPVAWLIALIPLHDWMLLVTQTACTGLTYLVLLWLFDRPHMLELRQLLFSRQVYGS